MVASRLYCQRYRIHHAPMKRLILLALLLPSLVIAQETPGRADWMREAKFGVMNHYLADWIARKEKLPDNRMTVEHWNDLIDHFDADRLAAQISGQLGSDNSIVIALNGNNVFSDGGGFAFFI